MPRAAATLAVVLTALLLGACGDDSETAGTATTAEPAESAATEAGARPNAWNHVNAPLREDILTFGEEGTAAEVEEAETVLHGYLDARTAEDFAKACTYLSKYMVSRTKGMAARQGARGCSSGIEALEEISSASEVEARVEINPDSIRGTGPRNFFIYEDGYGNTYAMLMRREGGILRIHGFEPTRLS